MLFHDPGELASHHQCSLNSDRLKPIEAIPPATRDGTLVLGVAATGAGCNKAMGLMFVPIDRYEVAEIQEGPVPGCVLGRRTGLAPRPDVASESRLRTTGQT
jgi:hypothetical protein